MVLAEASCVKLRATDLLVALRLAAQVLPAAVPLKPLRRLCL